MGLDLEIMKELVDEIAGKDVVVLVELIQGKEDKKFLEKSRKMSLIALFLGLIAILIEAVL